MTRIRQSEVSCLCELLSFCSLALYHIEVILFSNLGKAASLLFGLQFFVSRLSRRYKLKREEWKIEARQYARRERHAKKRHWTLAETWKQSEVSCLVSFCRFVH